MNRPKALLLLVLAVGLCWLVERLIVTDTEAIEALLDEALEAARARRLAPVRVHLAEDFLHQGRGPDEALAEAQRLLDTYQPTLLDLRRGPIVVAAPRAEAEIDMRVVAMAGLYAGRMGLVLRKDDGRWRIVEASDLPPIPAGAR